MLNSICCVVAKPLGVEQGTLGIRSAWACHQNGFETKLIYAEEGVWCAVGNPGYHTSLLRDLLGEDGEVYVVREDLERRGIAPGSVLEGVEIIPASDVAGICEDVESVNYF